MFLPPWAHTLPGSLPRHLVSRRRHSGCTFPPPSSSSSARSGSPANYRSNMASIRSCLSAGLFYAVPIAVFGSEHFTITADIARLVPRWIPAHTFWVYAVGVGFVCAGFSLASRVQARLAAYLLGATFLIFVIVMDLPGTLKHPQNRFFWALALRQLAFSGGAFAFAISGGSTRRHFSDASRSAAPWRAFPRFFIGIPAVFYGVEHFLHPEFAPGVPLQLRTPAWIHGRILLSYLLGAVLISGGACLLVNKKTRIAATSLGLAVLLAVVWVYLPIVLHAPTDLVALNYFFDTLFFCGAVLLLANAMPNQASAPENAKPSSATV